MGGVFGFDDEVEPLQDLPLRIGAPVVARDGRYGTLDKVVVNPYARQVTHLVVRHGGLLAEDRVIPIERIRRVDQDGIYLDASAAELDQYPPYQPNQFTHPLSASGTMAGIDAARTPVLS